MAGTATSCKSQNVNVIAHRRKALKMELDFYTGVPVLHSIPDNKACSLQKVAPRFQCSSSCGAGEAW